jgi:outer membrane protein OmpA-like peptidoglycan-associated protein
MNNPVLSLLFVLLSSGISPAQAAEEIQAGDLQQIESLQRRADNLGFGELAGADSYHLAKARAWLNMAASEYHQSDSSGTLAAAIMQAEALLEALENRQGDIGMDTPLQVQGSEAVRPDLLNKIAALKKHDKFSCGQNLVAEAEVYLVWAGHEYVESGLTHAQSYTRNVENLIYEARAAIDTCAGKVAAVPPPALEKITLSGDAMFEIGKATLNPAALWQLDRLAASIKKEALLEEVELVGHTDRLRSAGTQDINQLLSEQRAENIKQYLVGKGIPEEMIHARGVGASQPIVECSAKQSMKKQIACLQPNRRVEIILRGSR